MNLLNPGDPVLLLCPHPDDEIASGGLVSTLIERGHPVHYFYFSDCAESTRSLGFEAEVLIEECHKSCAVLGIQPDRIRGLDFPVRRFPQYRQEILEVLVAARREIEPKLVLCPASYDIHQDHATIAQESLRAFKHATILGYEFPWNQMESQTRFLATIEKRHLDIKIAAWNCYKSQAARAYHGHLVFEAMARVRGVQANVEFAEGYEVARAVVSCMGEK